jgi:hypothetical protein
MPRRPRSNLAEWAVFLAPAIALAIGLALMALLVR